MYQPPHFREEDLAAQHALIRAHPLGLLISVGAEGPIIDPVPCLLDPAPGTMGILRCHVARANPHWRAIGSGADILVVFQGAQHYIHPGWYETKRETGKVVPTWNYVMLEVQGRARVIEDQDWLGRQIRDLTRMMEGDYPDPWSVEDAPAAFIEAQMRGIVGIEIAIGAIAGKWKISQNRNAADRAGVAQGLRARGGETAAVMADLVAEKRD